MYKYLRNKNQQDAPFYFQFVSTINLYMFRARLLLIIRRYLSVYIAIGMCHTLCWLTTSKVGVEPTAVYTDKYLLESKTVHLVGSYCANISRCTVHKILKMYTYVYCLYSHQTAHSLLQQLTDYCHQTKSKIKSMHGRHTVFYILHNNLRNDSRVAFNDQLQHTVSRQSIKSGERRSHLRSSHVTR